MVEWDLNHHRDLNIRAQAEFMDGKGRALDNAITERFWRTLKREDICLKQHDTPKALRIGVDQYIQYYNYERTHSSLEGERPAEIYFSYNSATKKTA